MIWSWTKFFDVVDHRKDSKQIENQGFGRDSVYPTYPPNWIRFARKLFEIIFGQLQWGSRGEPDVSPTLHEFYHRFERIQAQSVVTVIGHVSHKNINLKCILCDFNFENDGLRHLQDYRQSSGTILPL